MDEDRAPPPESTRPDTLDHRRRRALFRATHRGTKETDRLLGGYVAPRVDAMDHDVLDALDVIMALPDVDLADWLMGRRPIPDAHDTPLLRAILADARTIRKA